MQKYVGLVGLMVLTGCSSTPNQTLVNTNVGIIIPSEHNNEFCYAYIGATVFHNKSDKHQISPNFSQGYENAVKKGVLAANNTPVVLGELKIQDISQYFIRSEWDHKITVTESGKQYLQDLTAKDNVDYIMLPWLYSLDRCMVSAKIGDYQGQYDLDSNIQLHLFNGRTFEHMQSRQVNSINSLREQVAPSNKAAPTEQEVRQLSNALYTELADDTYRFLTGDCCYTARDDLPK